MVEFDRSSEFTPAELDLLEDALEDLTILPEGASPELLGRIESFREILGLSDEALPPIDVPEGLLDSVLEEARRSPAVAIESAVTSAPGGLWQRLRRSLLLPGFALAATAALLIVVLKPDASPFDDLSEEADSSAAAEVSATERTATLTEKAADRRAEEERPAMVPAAAPSAAEQKADAVVEEEVAAAGALSDERRAPAPDEWKKRTAKSKKGAASPKDADVSVEPLKAEAEAEDELDAEDKAALRTLLQQADSDRQRGRCGSAVSAYSKLLGVRGNEEARALMGLGLCAEQEGDMTAAEGYYRRAKAINPALDSLISAERKRLAGAGSERSRKKAAPKPKPKSKKAQSLPFD